MEVALDAGADDVRESGDILEVVTAPDRFEAVKTALEKAGVALASAEVTMMPQSTVPISANHSTPYAQALCSSSKIARFSSRVSAAAHSCGGSRSARSGQSPLARRCGCTCAYGFTYR